ncbi:hypothetical protein MTX26_30575 [Bradyrhizobium sp. ISRA443]|uniref:hypothetical protein n=1 Tax=unclassified Bradyrhizobium TaxID=2631580 RepID=UPI002478A148|nr:MULTISPECIES: hypothetical protein [unclassified Bradyrhizobium]WGR93904.1 hypothetical protein MTX20_05565 [Bradyrhizobium sp. ISRA435]WGR98524.1 hypothetical protein MTX23_30560 [Bradyrhizobium sp. ISRA436]WGS05413.1 hypothetical protein MTX18_30580 [Bradyrhizobium sp. ISRA437]WGS12299.1 hypothetical protein MTX26_30575 [Bradyrhizobium sp. ISRA443]
MNSRRERAAATWIKRLDRNDIARTTVHVYWVKYGEAQRIARVLTDMFLGGASSSPLDSVDNQMAPGSGGTTLSSGDRLSLSGNAPVTMNSFSSRSGLGTAGAAGHPLLAGPKVYTSIRRQNRELRRLRSSHEP